MYRTSHFEKENLSLEIFTGYAWSGGGCKIWRVDITADKGQTWQPAEIVEQEDADPGRCWSWVLWRAEIPVQKSEKEVSQKI